MTSPGTAHDLEALASRLLLESWLPIPSTETRPVTEWHPSAPVAVAQRLLRSVERMPRELAGDRLAAAAGQLLGAARIAWWPLAERGELDVSADEKPGVLINETGIDAGWLDQQTRLGARELRHGIHDLLADATMLEGAPPETARVARIEKVALPAVTLATRAALLAVTHDPDVLGRINRTRGRSVSGLVI